MEGGAELIGTNHAIWLDYAQRSRSRSSTITEEDAEVADRPERPAPDGGAESEALWKELESALSVMNADAARVPDAFAGGTAPDAAAWDKRTLAEWIAAQPCSASVQDGHGHAARRRQRRHQRVAELSRQPRAGQRGRRQKYWTETEVYRMPGGNQQLALQDRGRDRVSRTSTCVSRSTSITAGDRGVVRGRRRREARSGLRGRSTVPPLTWNRIAFTPRAARLAAFRRWAAT